LNLIRCYFC